MTRPPGSPLDLSGEPINEKQAQVPLGKIMQTRERVRIWLIVGLGVIVVGIIIVNLVAAWTLTGDPNKNAAWEHVNAVAGVALASFLTLLGSAIGWYFSEQANRI